MRTLEVEVQPVGGGVRPSRRRLRRALVVLGGIAAILVALVSTGTVPPATGPATRPGRIVVVDRGGGLSTVAPDGTGRRSLAVPGVQFQFPAWSPDGTRIAAIGGDGVEGGVYVFDDPATHGGATSGATSSEGVGGGRSPTIVYPPSRQYPIYLYWSPDGTRISFITSEAGSLALRVVPAGGGAPSSVIRSGQPMYWDWIDAAHLLVHSGGGGPDAFVGEVGLDGSTADGIDRAPGEFQAPGVSSDGSERAYVTGDASGQNRVVVEDRARGTQREVPVGGASALAWQPGGEQLAFTSPPRDNGLPFGALKLLDARSGLTRTLLDGLVESFFWSPDGASIAAIRVVAAGGETAALVLPTGAVATALQLSVVEVASGDVRLARTIRLPILIANQFVPFFDQYALSHRIWSPSGDRVVLPLVDDTGVVHVTIVPVDGSVPTTIADGVAAFWSP